MSASADVLACGRCEADLDAYRAMHGKAQALLEKAAQALSVNPAQALRLAERSRRLHATEAASRLIMLGQLCTRQYSTALANWLEHTCRT
jgi:N-acetylglucosamine-6-phosphate deacetylase